MMCPYSDQFCYKRWCGICEVYYRWRNEYNHQALSVKAVVSSSIGSDAFALPVFLEYHHQMAGRLSYAEAAYDTNPTASAYYSNDLWHGYFSVDGCGSSPKSFPPVHEFGFFGDKKLTNENVIVRCLRCDSSIKSDENKQYGRVCTQKLSGQVELDSMMLVSGVVVTQRSWSWLK